jgi:hypothetical protein
MEKTQIFQSREYVAQLCSRQCPTFPVIISWAGATNTHGHNHDLDLEQKRGLLPSSGTRDQNQISSEARVASYLGTFFVLFFLIDRTESVAS